MTAAGDVRVGALVEWSAGNGATVRGSVEYVPEQPAGFAAVRPLGTEDVVLIGVGVLRAVGAPLAAGTVSGDPRVDYLLGALLDVHLARWIEERSMPESEMAGALERLREHLLRQAGSPSGVSELVDLHRALGSGR